jgi:hypothetical protein
LTFARRSQSAKGFEVSRIGNCPAKYYHVLPL